MTLRRPVYYDESASAFQTMTGPMLKAIRSLAVYAYGDTSQIVPTLGVVSSGGDFGNLSDTRKQAGAYRTFVNRFPNEGETAEPGTVTVNYNRFDVNNFSIAEPTDTSNRRYPLYLDGDNNLRAMTEQDFFDTFITQAIDIICDGNDRPGVYKIRTSNSSFANHTLVSSTAVFSDTRANTGVYSASGIPETLDQPTTINNFYLYRGNKAWDLVDIDEATFNSTFVAPTVLTSGSDIQTLTKSDLETILKDGINWRASTGGTGNTIRYNINGSGQQRGSGMTNTILNGAGVYRTRYVNTNDYRAQEHPNGTAVTSATYALNINRE